MAAHVDDYAYKLRIMDSLRAKVIERAVLDLEISGCRSILDAGCGVGGNLPLLAGLAGEAAHVTGLDISDEFISLARKDVIERGLGERISLVRGDIKSMPFGYGEFDCVVSVDCGGYPYSADPASLMRELRRVAGPGGVVALLGWSCQQLLPGHSLLESRLNTASSLTAFSGAGDSPATHFFAAPGWFQNTGFVSIKSKSYLGDIHSPLSDKEKEAVLALFDMLWSDSRGAVSDDEWQLYERISRPGTADFLLEKPDYYGFFIYTCFSGQVPDSC